MDAAIMKHKMECSMAFKKEINGSISKVHDKIDSCDVEKTKDISNMQKNIALLTKDKDNMAKDINDIKGDVSDIKKDMTLIKEFILTSPQKFADKEKVETFMNSINLKIAYAAWITSTITWTVLFFLNKYL